MAKKVNPYNVLAHGWGKSPEQKAKEKAYNHKYYLENKNKWKTLYNDTANTHGGTVDSLDKSIAGAEARVTATKNEYDKVTETYRKAINDYQDFLNTIPKVGSQRTREQNRMLEDRQERLKEMKADYEKVEKTYRNAQNDLKSQMTERDRAQGQINRMKQRADRAQSEYDAYENSEAGESERYKRELNMLKNRRDKNWERYSYYESQTPTKDVQKQINQGTWTREKYLKEHGNLPEKAEQEALKAEKDIRALASKRRASAMARSAQAAQQKTQESRKQFQKQQQAVEQQANRDISTQKQRATNIQRQMKATQDKVSQLMETLNDGMSKGYNKNNNYMQKIAKQIKDEQDKLAKQREQLNTVNTAIKTLEKKAKQAHDNI